MTMICFTLVVLYPKRMAGGPTKYHGKFRFEYSFNYSLGRRMINVIRHVTPFNTEGPIFRDLTKVTFGRRKVI